MDVISPSVRFWHLRKQFEGEKKVRYKMHFFAYSYIHDGSFQREREKEIVVVVVVVVTVLFLWTSEWK